MAKPLDIAVIGAGVAGLASAIMLARGGHRVAACTALRRAGGRSSTA